MEQENTGCRRSVSREVSRDHHFTQTCPRAAAGNHTPVSQKLNQMLNDTTGLPTSPVFVSSRQILPPSPPPPPPSIYRQGPGPRSLPVQWPLCLWSGRPSAEAWEHRRRPDAVCKCSRAVSWTQYVISSVTWRACETGSTGRFVLCRYWLFPFPTFRLCRNVSNILITIVWRTSPAPPRYTRATTTPPISHYFHYESLSLTNSYY